MNLRNDIPFWVNWIAQDKDGAWWGYEVEPLEYDSGWYENEIGKSILLKKELPNPDWRFSLTKRVRNGYILNQQ